MLVGTPHVQGNGLTPEHSDNSLTPLTPKVERS